LKIAAMKLQDFNQKIYNKMKKKELIENIINGNLLRKSPVTIFNGEIVYVNEDEFNIIFDKINENNWVNKEKENCNTIIVGRFIVIKVDSEIKYK
jgi:hypothetical protein